MTKESSMHVHVHVHTNLTILQCCHLDAPVQYPNLHLDGIQHLKTAHSYTNHPSQSHSYTNLQSHTQS